jgi:multiple sugar transport system permease protein
MLIQEKSARVTPGKERRGSLRSRVDLFPYVLILPALLVISFVIFYPIVEAIRTSLYSITIAASTQGEKFIGLANYFRVLSKPVFWNQLWVTFVYTFGTVVISYVVGLLAALLVEKPFWGRSVVRTVLLMPWILPHVVIATVFILLYDVQFGVANYLLELFGFDPLQWLSDPSWAMPAVIIATSWSQYPIAFIMLLAGMLMIPEELYEAAEIDGANKLQLFWYVTMPSLRPISTVIILLFTIWNFKRFDYIFVMTGGGPLHATETLIVETYLRAFKYWEVGHAAALGTITLLISVIFTIIYLFFVRKGEIQEG